MQMSVFEGVRRVGKSFFAVDNFFGSAARARRTLCIFASSSGERQASYVGVSLNANGLVVGI